MPSAEKLIGQPFVAISIRVLDACLGNPNALQLYATLCRYVNRERLAWPGQYRLAKDLGVSRRTLQRSLGDLKDLGLVETVENREVGGTFSELVYHVLLTPKDGVLRAPAVAHGGVHRAPKPSAKSVADQLDPNELDPVQTVVEKTEPKNATEALHQRRPDLKPEPLKPRKKKGKHATHPYCGTLFCVDAEKHARFEQRIRAAGGDPSDLDLIGMYRDWDIEFTGTDHPHLYLEKSFSAALRDSYGDQSATA